MSLEERGALFTALLHGWMGPLPKDVQRLARLFNCDRSELEAVMPAVEKEFENHSANPEGEWVVTYCEAERAKQKRRRENSAEGGKISAELRRIKKEESTEPKGGATVKTDEEIAADQKLFNEGSAFLQQYKGTTNADARSFMGKLAKDFGKAIALISLERAMKEKPLNAFEFMMATCQAEAGTRRKNSKGQQSQDAAEAVKAQLKAGDVDGK